MKKKYFKNILTVIVIISFFALIKWAVGYNDNKEVSNKILFTLVGIGYILANFLWKDKSLRLVYFTSGILILIGNYFLKGNIQSILIILGILIPPILVRFLEKETEKIN